MEIHFLVFLSLTNPLGQRLFNLINVFLHLPVFGCLYVPFLHRFFLIALDLGLLKLLTLLDILLVNS